MGNARYDVFISYSSIDQKYAEAVCHKIEDNGLRCFIAYRDIRGGEDWAMSIMNAIRNTKVFVLLFSENSGQSNQVHKEVTLATKVKSTIIPFKLDDVEVERCKYGFEYHLCDCHWIDAVPMNNEAVEKLVEQVKVNVVMNSKTNSNELLVDDEFTGNILKEFSKDDRKSVDISKISDNNKESYSNILEELGLSSAEELEELRRFAKERKSKQSQADEIRKIGKTYEIIKEPDKDYEVIEFGYYPQSEVKGDKLTENIVNASYNKDGDALVNGQVYRRLYKTDATYSTENNKNYYDWKDRECLYFKYEPIRWRVLSREGNELFLLAESAIDDRRYNERYMDVTWETCTLREWLNNQFIMNAFNAVERNMIEVSKNRNDNNTEYSTDGGNDTQDRVFLLSEAEATNKEYGFKGDNNRIAKCTDYARAMGALTDEKSGGSCWWLRSPGLDGLCAALVGNLGWVYRAGPNVFYDSASIRPALKINL